MKFNFEMRLLGFYNAENQRMFAEEFRLEEAKVLAELFDKSFSSISFDEGSLFTTALKGNGVFIFRDKKYNLYAYYPKEHIAKITEVRYNKKAINEVEYNYKKWFIPGEPFEIDIYHRNTVNFCSLSLGEWESFDIDEHSIYRNCNDYFIKLRKSTYAIGFEEIINITDLVELLSHKWICLEERLSRDFCGNCDGWEYSGCDMDRCREYCDGCGGRTYKCNNRCFKYRNKSFIKICLSSSMQKEFQEGMEILAKVQKPLTTDADYWWDSYQSFFESLNNEFDYLNSYLNLDSTIRDSFNREYKQAALLQKYRHSKISTIEIEIVHTPTQREKYKIPYQNVIVGEGKTGMLFWKKKYHYVSFDGYDFLSDFCIEKHSYILKKNNIYLGLEKRAMINHTLKKIILIEDIKTNDWDYWYE